MNQPGESQRLEHADQSSAAAEGRFHTYVGNRIPWYVRLLWVCFWVFAVYYVITYLFPDLQTTIFNPQ
jgi:hypothetical protein